MTGYTYITPQQIVDSLVSIFGKENIGSPKDISPTDDNGNSTFNFDYFGVDVRIKFNDKYGLIKSYPTNRFLENFVNIYNINQDPERKDISPIFITPEIIVNSLKEIYGDKFSFTNFENNENRITFKISFFEQQLNVVLCKVTGNVISFPRNTNLNEFIIELNANYSKKNESLTSKLPTRSAKPFEEMSKKQIIRPGCTLKPLEAREELLARFGAENINLIGNNEKRTDGHYHFDLIYFGVYYRIIFDELEGVSSTPDNEKLADVIIDIQSNLACTEKTAQNKTITPKQITNNFNSKYGASSVSEPQSIVDNGNGNCSFKINYFGQDLNVTLNNGKIETEPKNENFETNVLKQIKEMN